MSELSWLDEPLRMISVRLPREAFKTYRTLNDGNPDLYPVLVGFNRPANEYERLALKDFGVIPRDNDGMWARIEDTTLEAISDNLDEYNAELDAATEAARVMRDEAQAEDERLRKGALQLIYRLRSEHGLDAPPEDKSWRKS